MWPSCARCAWCWGGMSLLTRRTRLWLVPDCDWYQTVAGTRLWLVPDCGWYQTVTGQATSGTAVTVVGSVSDWRVFVTYETVKLRTSYEQITMLSNEHYLVTFKCIFNHSCYYQMNSIGLTIMVTIVAVIYDGCELHRKVTKIHPNKQFQHENCQKKFYPSHPPFTS